VTRQRPAAGTHPSGQNFQFVAGDNSILKSEWIREARAEGSKDRWNESRFSLISVHGRGSTHRIKFSLLTGAERFIECLAENVHKIFPPSPGLTFIAPPKPSKRYVDGTAIKPEPQPKNRSRPYEVSDKPAGVERPALLQDAVRDTVHNDTRAPFDGRCIPAAGQPVNEGFKTLTIVLVQDIVRVAPELRQERADAFGPVGELPVDQPAYRREKASAMRRIPRKATHQVKSPDFIKLHRLLPLRVGAIIRASSGHAMRASLQLPG
jgi:hypothetical protein